MSRRRRAVKREIKPDPRFQNQLVSRFINIIMERGKKSTAQTIVYQAFELASEKLEKGDPVDILLGALENTRPKLEVKNRRVGGATYPVPVEVPYERQVSKALRWIKEAARKRKGKSMSVALSEEIIDAYGDTGSVVRKKDEAHKMAQANKAFAHLKW